MAAFFAAACLDGADFAAAALDSTRFAGGFPDAALADATGLDATGLDKGRLATTCPTLAGLAGTLPAPGLTAFVSGRALAAFAGFLAEGSGLALLTGFLAAACLTAGFAAAFAAGLALPADALTAAVGFAGLPLATEGLAAARTSTALPFCSLAADELRDVFAISLHRVLAPGGGVL